MGTKSVDGIAERLISVQLLHQRLRHVTVWQHNFGLGVSSRIQGGT